MNSSTQREGQQIPALDVLFQAVYQGQEVSFVEVFTVMCDPNTHFFVLILKGVELEGDVVAML